MVNNQTSQYEYFFLLFLPFSIFNYVREILQLSLPIDHPVAPIPKNPDSKAKFAKKTIFFCAAILHPLKAKHFKS